ncbi:MAG: DUF484 family protein [Gammaproteobacteria bacterium]|nr:DUF484 family protein [Gammaproteobacteria bacterium]
MSKVQEVVDYLKANPDFFVHYPELLADMDFSKHSETPSFHQRQLQVLKDREYEQQTRLDIIMDSAKANLQLEQGLHNLSARLISHQHEKAGQSSEKLIELIIELFIVDRISIILEKNENNPESKVDYSFLSQRVAHRGSICDDRLASALIVSIFGQSEKKIRSCAFLPLSFEEKIKGVMVIGSIDQDRFKPGFGVMFLDQLALLSSAYLQPDLTD